MIIRNETASDFDAIWASSYTMSTFHGFRDDEKSFPFERRIELIAHLIDLATGEKEIIWNPKLGDEVYEGLIQATQKVVYSKNKPIIYDGDSASVTDIANMVRTLEAIGVEMVLVEDKTGPKYNPLFSDGHKAKQDTAENFARNS